MPCLFLKLTHGCLRDVSNDLDDVSLNVIEEHRSKGLLSFILFYQSFENDFIDGTLNLVSFNNAYKLDEQGRIRENILAVKVLDKELDKVAYLLNSHVFVLEKCKLIRLEKIKECIALDETLISRLAKKSVAFFPFLSLANELFISVFHAPKCSDVPLAHVFE